MLRGESGESGESFGRKSGNVEKGLVGKVEKVEKLIACFGRCCGAATSWPFIGKHKERCSHYLFRSEM